jgi:hypothetical protein
MDYTKLASNEILGKVITAFEPRNFKGVVVDTKEEALDLLKELIPANATVTNGASRTLEEIGFMEYFKEGEHGWDNLHAKVLEEPDPVKQVKLRRISSVSDFYLGSAHAVTEDGQLFFASNTGSQFPSIAFNAQNVVLVVGAQKIVPNLEAAYARLETHIMPLEEVNMQQKYGIGTQHNKTLILRGENPMFGRNIQVIFVRETLGF